MRQGHNIQFHLFVFAGIMVVVISCTGAFNYYKAKIFHSEKNYEAALDAIIVATEANPNNEEYKQLKQRLVFDFYRSKGLPVIAYNSLLETQLGGKSFIDNSQQQEDAIGIETLLDEIETKYTIPIIVRILDNFNGIDKQCIQDKVKEIFEKIGDDKHISFRLYNFSDFDFLLNRDKSASVLVEIESEDYAKEVERGQTIDIQSKYAIKTKERNLERESLETLLHRLKKYNYYVTKMYMSEVLKLHPSLGDRLLDIKELEMRLKRNSKRQHEIEEKLKSEPIYLEKVRLFDYFATENDYNISARIKVKFRLVDYYNNQIWTEDNLELDKRKVLKEIKDVHPADVNDKANRNISEKDIEEELHTARKEMCSQIVEKLKYDIVKIPYYRAKDFEKNGLLADAWECFYIFLEIGDGKSKEYSYARSFVDQDPLSYIIKRNKSVIRTD